MASNEFLSLTDSQSGEPVYIDPATIIQVTQIAQNKYPRRSRIDTSQGYVFIVREEATAIVLATGRGFQDVDPVADAAASDLVSSPTAGGWRAKWESGVNVPPS